MLIWRQEGIAAVEKFGSPRGPWMAASWRVARLTAAASTRANSGLASLPTASVSTSARPEPVSASHFLGVPSEVLQRERESWWVTLLTTLICCLHNGPAKLSIHVTLAVFAFPV